MSETPTSDGPTDEADQAPRAAQLRAAPPAQGSSGGAEIELARALACEGIDPERVLDYAVPAIVRVAGGEPLEAWLEPLADFVRRVHRGGVAVWSAVTYGVPFVTRLAGSSHERFSAGLGCYGELLVSLAARGADGDRLVTHASGPLGEALAGQAWALAPLCRLAERVAATGGEPGHIWTILVHAWAEALVPKERSAGEPLAVAGRQRFERALELLGGVLERAPAAGMHAGSRLADGLATFARYGERMEPFLEEWLELVLALARSLNAQGSSPYLPIGNGLGGVVGHLAPEEVAPVLAFAVSLADRGLDSGGVLHEAFLPAAEALGTGLALEFGQRLAAAGCDPFTPLRDAAAAIGRASWTWADATRLDLVQDLLDELVRTARAAGVETGVQQRYFTDAVPLLAERLGTEPASLLATLRLATGLAERGVSPGLTFAYGWPTVLELAEAQPWLVEEARAIIDELGARGIDPHPTLARALPVLVAIAEGARAAFTPLCRTLLDLVTALQSHGLDARDVLYRDIAALADVRGTDGAAAFRELLLRLRALLDALAENGHSPRAFLAAGLAAAASAAGAGAWRLDASLAWMSATARAGRDGSAILQHAAGAIAAADRGEPERFVALLGATERAAARWPVSAVDWLLAPLVRAALHVSSGDPTAFAAALGAASERFRMSPACELSTGARATPLPFLAELAGAELTQFAHLIARARSAGERLAAHGRWPADLLWYALPALCAVAAGRPVEGAACLDAVADELIAAPPSVGRALVRPPSAARSQGESASGLELLARAAHGDALALQRALGPLFAGMECLRRGDDLEPAPALELVRFAAAVPPGTPESLVETLAWLARLIGAEADEGAAARIVASLSVSRTLVQRHREAWPSVVRPALVAHGVRAAAVLRPVCAIAERWVQRASDLELLGTIVAQFGVRAPEILQGLLLRGLQTRSVADLTAERELLLRFLREVPLADPEVYAVFREIQQDTAASAGQKRARVAALQDGVQALSAAVRSGEVSDQQARHPLFPLVLYHVFPPAVTVAREEHMRLFARFADHADHVDVFAPGECRSRTYTLRQGAWELRPGAVIDRSAWWMFAEADAEVPGEPAAETSAAALGWDLLVRWAEGRIGRGAIQAALLARVFRQARAGGCEPPRHTASPLQLIACREFLGDRVRDIVEVCLIAARSEDPLRYGRLVRAKLAPDTSIGPGLVRALWALAQDLAAGRLEPGEATQRATRQLQNFSLEPATFLAALTACASRAEVLALLQQLQPVEFELEAGKEQAQLMADFVGQELAAMQRELFGGDGAPAKLEYVRASSAAPLALTCEVTKRRAHAPVGHAQGVCVATDQQLWDRPTFFQVIFWSPSGIAWGGMHVLLVEDAGGRYVALPGINPAAQLVELVEPAALLEVACDYAWCLARACGAVGVWIPTAPAIHSNRRAIHQELAQRDLPTRTTREHPFSYSPYRYSFREVFEVPQPSAAG